MQIYICTYTEAACLQSASAYWILDIWIRVGLLHRNIAGRPTVGTVNNHRSFCYCHIVLAIHHSPVSLTAPVNSKTASFQFPDTATKVATYLEPEGIYGVLHRSHNSQESQDFYFCMMIWVVPQEKKVCPNNANNE